MSLSKFKDFLIESSLSRLWSKFNDHDAGIITAFRGSKTKQENRNNNAEMLSYLKRKGYSLTKVKGSYIENFGKEDAKEVGEESFVVVDQNDTKELKKDLIKMGRLYDQDSVLFIAKDEEAVLIGTNRSDFPGFNKEISVGRAKFGKDANEFFSRINGRQFAFENIESVEEMKDPENIMGKQAMKLVAEDVERRYQDLFSSYSNAF